MAFADVGPCIFKALVVRMHKLILLELESVLHRKDFVG